MKTNSKVTLAGFSLAKFGGNWVFANNRCSIQGKNIQMLADVLVKGNDNESTSFNAEDFFGCSNQEVNRCSTQ